MNELMHTFAVKPEFLIGLVLGTLGILGAAYIVTICVRTSIRGTCEREQTKREIAAYVAEGSLTSEDAERILAANGWTGFVGSCGREAKKWRGAQSA